MTLYPTNKTCTNNVLNKPNKHSTLELNNSLHNKTSFNNKFTINAINNSKNINKTSLNINQYIKETISWN